MDLKIIRYFAFSREVNHPDEDSLFDYFRCPWAFWKWKESGGRFEYQPYEPDSLTPAPTDKIKGFSFRRIIEAVKENGHLFDGIGVVLTKQSQTCIRLKDCVRQNTASTGCLHAEWAMKIVRELQSYVEYAPSGRDIHIWFNDRHGVFNEVVTGKRIGVYRPGQFIPVTGTFNPMNLYDSFAQPGKATLKRLKNDLSDTIQKERIVLNWSKACDESTAEISLPLLNELLESYWSEREAL